MTFLTKRHARVRGFIQLYLPWFAVYTLLVGGITVFGTTMLDKYKERHLPQGTVELAVGKTRYQLGEVVEFTVTNHFPVSIYITNHCPKEPLSVYRWDDNRWVQLHGTALGNGECYMQERNVEILSEEARSYNFKDWPDLFSVPGVYRIAAAIDYYNGVPFSDFVVLEPAEVRVVEKNLVEDTPAVLPAAAVAPPAKVIPDYEEDEAYEEHDDRERDEEEEYEDDD